MIETMKTPMRQRLLTAASELFYAEGLRAVSVERIIERAETTKVTFYRHFSSKEELILAYLDGQAATERAGIGAAIEAAAGSPDVGFQAIAGTLAQMADDPAFRGCPFINAAAEYPERDSPVRRAVKQHREWCTAAFAELIAPLDLPDPGATATDLMLLRDGAMVAGYLDEPAALAASFLRSARAVTGLA